MATTPGELSDDDYLDPGLVRYCLDCKTQISRGLSDRQGRCDECLERHRRIAAAREQEQRQAQAAHERAAPTPCSSRIPRGVWFALAAGLAFTCLVMGFVSLLGRRWTRPQYRSTRPQYLLVEYKTAEWSTPFYVVLYVRVTNSTRYKLHVNPLLFSMTSEGVEVRCDLFGSDLPVANLDPGAHVRGSIAFDFSGTRGVEGGDVTLAYETPVRVRAVKNESLDTFR
ncbi:MAG: hypothetical protein ACE5R4_04925 [Armatimonadota bacterium]